MAKYMQKPENALKRANEFIDVGKPAQALDTLQEVFRNKKFSYTWSETVIEPIMFKYLDLCVELKKSHVAKEGLFQYRNMFQLVNVSSLENVIRGYLKMAEERTEAAQQQSSQAVLDIDDLDNLATPEGILMSAVCGEDAQDRSDRTILLPWVKFLWESYGQCVELLKVNSHCETLYHEIARMAFQFCLKYNRKMEFRKLSEKLRKHLDDICKVPVNNSNVSITKPETQQLNLDTRLYQLDSAIQMELWQEAYKAIEDIHGLMALSKKVPLPKTMANYYQKLAMVFWKAKNQLFHAAALLRLFQLSRELKKTITSEEIQRMASHVLVATLAIPLPSAHPEYDRFIETDKSPQEKAQRLATLLKLQQAPTRALLLKEIIRANVFQLAAPEFQNLHKWMEIDYDPLNLCKNVESVIEGLNKDPGNPLLQYVESLQYVTLVRLTRQISQVYQSIEFPRLLELARFSNAFQIERILVDCVRHNDMQITIDHKQQCVHFGTDLSESQREDNHDGPTLQSMPSEQVRQQLVNMSIVLHRSIVVINPTHMKYEREKMRSKMIAAYHENKVKEHQNILIRQKLIEDRKEYIERLNTEREEEEIRRQGELQRQQRIAEKKRIELEMEERERKRQENELQQIKYRNIKEKIQQISQTTHGQKILKIIEERGSADPEEIAKEEQNALIRERKEIQSKLKSQEKKVDYFERAKRLEEIPLIEEWLANMAIKDEVFWKTQEKMRIDNAIAERQTAVALQSRVKLMKADRDAYLETLRPERKNVFAEKLKKFNEALDEERKRRLAQRVEERRNERREKWLAEKKQERQRKLTEMRKEKEEQDRLEQERRSQEEAARQEKLRLQSEKQRAREEEAEKKITEEREKARARDREMQEQESRDTKDTRDSRTESTWRTTRDSPRESNRDSPRESQDSTWRAQPAGREGGSAWRDKGSKDNSEGGRESGSGGGRSWRFDNEDNNRDNTRRMGPSSGSRYDNKRPVRQEGRDGRDGRDGQRDSRRGGSNLGSGSGGGFGRDSTDWRKREEGGEGRDRPRSDGRTKDAGSSWRRGDEPEEATKTAAKPEDDEWTSVRNRR